MKMASAIADIFSRAPLDTGVGANKPLTPPAELYPKQPNALNGLPTPPEDAKLEKAPAALGVDQLAGSTMLITLNTPPKHHVLAVDDNAINLRILTRLIKELGYSYATASNGFEALQLYRAASESQPFSFIFMDISMPVMNGFVAAQEIRAHEVEHNMTPARIVALTGIGSASSEQEALASGIDLFLTKPVSLQKLKALLIEVNGT
jgi:CheY-like chemotaxis protein